MQGTKTEKKMLAHVDKQFTFKSYTEEERTTAKEILACAHTFATTLVKLTKEGPDQTVAIRKIKEAVDTVLGSPGALEPWPVEPVTPST